MEYDDTIRDEYDYRSYDDMPQAILGGIRYPDSKQAKHDSGDEQAKYDSRDELAARRDRLEREAARLSERIAMLENLPDEPELLDEESAVIRFTRTFSKRGAKQYDYAAIKAGDGLWYTTGPRTPKGYKWAELIQWIQENGPVEVWVVSQYEAL